MIYARILLSFWNHFVVLATVADSLPTRIPIGALFDKNSLQAYTAFRYEIGKHNNQTTASFKFDCYAKIIDVSNSYKLTKSICANIAKGTFAFFGVANVSTMGTIDSYSRTFHMPFINPSVPLDNQATASSYTLRMRPAYHDAIIDVISFYKWRTVFYLYDTNEGLLRLPHLYHAIRKKKLKIELLVLRIVNTNNCYALLRQLDSRTVEGDKYIVLDMSSERALQAILAQIQNVGMNRATYHYLLGGLVMDELDLDDFKHGGVNITGFRLLKPDRIRHMQREWYRLNPNYWKGAGPGMKIKLDTALTMDALSVIVKGLNRLKRENHSRFQATFRKDQIHNNQGISCSDKKGHKRPVPFDYGLDIMKAFRSVSFPGMTGQVTFDDKGQRVNYSLDLLELNLDREPRKIGTWSCQDRLSVEQPVHIPEQKKDKNKTRIITSILSAPYLMLKREPEDGVPLVGNDRFEGYCAELAEMVAGIVGFDYIIRLVKDKKYGSRLDDGNWNGMVGELSRGEADLAVAPLTTTLMRERLIDFSKPFMSLGISIMIKKPEKQKPGVFSFMDPLSYEIWLYVILAYVGVSVVLFVVSRFSPYEWQIEDSVNGPTFTNDFTILNSLWFALGAIMQQGCDISPRSMSGRIVGGVWWFCTLILISSYTANLAAFLTVERMLTPIESADDLAKQTAIQYGTLSAGSTQNFFRKSEIPVYQRMWAFMQSAQPSVFVEKTALGVQKVKDSKGKYAFLLESTMNDYHNQLKPCNTMKVGGNLDSKGYGIATPLGSSLREPISVAVLQLRESGFLQKLHKKWWYDKGECGGENDGKGSKQSALTLSNVAGVFYILIGGLALAMITSVLEFVYKSRVETKRQKVEAILLF
ncbi:Glutamate receptor 1 [Lamellibrachia satsuma]|nr:Glutamate receptor 1 [Lamellibrachia satsuma]